MRTRIAAALARTGRVQRFSADLNGESEGAYRDAKAPRLQGFRLNQGEAGERTRTVDTQLGKLVLYQLSYAREAVSLAARPARLRRS
jgi:hypothetical protein